MSADLRAHAALAHLAASETHLVMAALAWLAASHAHLAVAHALGDLR